MRHMRTESLGKYAAVARTQVLYALAYPADLAGRSLTIVLFLWIFFHLWTAAYQAAGRSAIAGLSVADTLWYLMVAETITLSRPRLSGAIAEAVRSGAIAYQLSRPCSFLLYQFGVGLGDTFPRLLCNAAAGGALTWLLVGPPPHPARLPLVLAAVLGAWALGFCLDALIGLLAFVAEDVAAFEWICSKLTMVLGGLLIPLDFFPPWLRSVALGTPFAYAVYGPARCFVAADGASWWGLLAGQTAWLAVLGGTLALAYRRGLVRLSINGG